MVEPGHGPTPGWVRTLLRLALLTWPADRRRVDGRALLHTSESLVGEAREEGRHRMTTEALGEAWALVKGGLGLRVDDARGGASDLVAGWGTDVRSAVRSLRRAPGFSAVATATLAVGIGANVALFGLVDAVLLTPPPYDRPESLAFVWGSLPGSSDRVALAGPDAQVLRDRARSLAGVAFATRAVDGSLGTGGSTMARHVVVAEATPDLFEVLGIEPSLGRLFTPEDAAVDSATFSAATVVVLSHGAWIDQLGGDPSVLGREVRVDGVPVTVIGVLPADFHLWTPPDAGLDMDVDVWAPLTTPLSAFHRADGRILDQDSDNSGVVVARLAPRAHLDDARVEIARIGTELRSDVPAYGAAGLDLSLRSLPDDLSADGRPLLLTLFAGAGLVLLVTCLNLATLLIARGLGRSGELAIRSALGAGRVRIARQLFVESSLVVTVGTLGALAVARGTLAGLAGRLPVDVAPMAPLGLNGRTGLFAVTLAAAVAVVFGLAPIARRRTFEASAGVLRTIGRHASPGCRRGRDALVVAEVALSVILVLGAGLMLRSVRQLGQVDPGFRSDGALAFRAALRSPDAYRSPGERARLMKEIADGVGALPGVQAVGLSGALPLGGDRWTQPYGLPGQAPSKWHENRADFRMVSSGYFAALGASVVEGRVFTTEEDVEEGERVVVIDERLARRLAPAGSALDAVIGIPLDGDPVEARVVGVVHNIRHERLDEDGREAVFVPYRQEASRDVAFVVRTSGDPSALGPAVQRVVREIDPGVPVYDVTTMDAYVRAASAPRRFALSLLGAFSALGLLCAALGLYGVVAFEVQRRTRDIGLRMALGADRWRVLREILGDGIRLTLAGFAAGVVLAQPAIRAMRVLVFEVGPNDLGAWAVTLGSILVLTLLACWLPALRASRLAPTDALRSE